MNLKSTITAIVLSVLPFAVYAQPSATMITTDTPICVKDTIRWQIKLSGQEPYGFVYERIVDGSSNILTELDGDIFDVNLVDGVWTSTPDVINKHTTIRIIEVFDKSSIQPWTYGLGTEVKDQSFTVTIDAMPNPSAGIDTTTCGFGKVLNGRQDIPGSTISWQLPADVSVDDVNHPNAFLRAKSPGIYTITLEEVNGTCTNTASANIEFLGAPRVDVSGDQIICSNDGNNYSIGVTTSFDGVAPFNYTLTNGADSYNRTVTSDTDNINIPATEATIYTAINVTDGNNCTAHVDSIHGQATVTDNKPTAFAGDNVRSCTNTQTLAAVLSKGEGGKWLPTAGISFSDDLDANAVATAATYGPYTLTWEEAYQGCKDQSTVGVLFVEAPDVDILKADTTICNGNQAVLRLKGTSSHYPLALEYTDGTNVFNQSMAVSAVQFAHAPSASTNYTLSQVTDAQGCNSTLTDVFAVKVDDMPVAAAGALVDKVCGNKAELKAVLKQDEEGMWKVTYGTLSAPTNVESDFTIDASNQIFEEIHEVRWVAVNTLNRNCKDSIDFDVTFNKQPSNVVAGDNALLYLKYTKELSATGLENGMSGLWSSVGGHVVFSDENGANTTASQLNMGSNKLIWTVANGVCEAVNDTIEIRVKGLTNPTGFSPNGDGINEEFMIGGAGTINNNKLTVFDINGKVVYTQNGFGANDSGWNGVSEDGELLEGTFYYIFTGDGIDPVKDYLIIRRTEKK